jgi:hypothetical protein
MCKLTLALAAAAFVATLAGARAADSGHTSLDGLNMQPLAPRRDGVPATTNSDGMIYTPRTDCGTARPGANPSCHTDQE